MRKPIPPKSQVAFTGFEPAISNENLLYVSMVGGEGIEPTRDLGPPVLQTGVSTLARYPPIFKKEFFEILNFMYILYHKNFRKSKKIFNPGVQGET